MKKIFTVIICCLFLLNLTGCGNNENNSKSIFNKGLKTKNLSIEDFKWETKETRIEGEKSYVMTITNNSEYDILGAEIHYKLKDSVNKEDLKTFDAFMTKHADWFDEDETVENITLIGNRNKLTKKGETLNQIILFIGMDITYWYDIPTEEQFNLMKPYELQLAIIGKDNKTYMTYYDFDNKKWSIDEITMDMNKWTKNNLANTVIKPTCEYYMLTSEIDEDNELDFTCYGATKEYFKQYAEETRKAGFNIDAPETNNYDTYFSAKNKEDINISISYDKDNEILEVSTYSY